ncbi:MAG: tetratricopeptide repeat protein, partial [Gemmatimonadaceae bacterium]
VLALEPRNVNALILLGNAYSYGEKHDQAITFYRRALAIEPNNMEARLGLGRALVYAGQDAAGATELSRVLAMEPGNVEALEALAVAQDSRAPSAAIETYQTLLSRTTDAAKRARILAAIGDLQLGKTNDLDAAAQSYAAAAQLAPRDAKINLNYAQILGYQDKYADAGPVVERVLAADPNNPRALALQLQVAVKSGDSARATELSNRLASVAPKTAEDALALADALREAGNRDAATALLARASSMAANPALALRIANATRDAGDYAVSVPLYNRLIQGDPNNLTAHVELARALFYQHQLDAAQDQADRVLQVSPDNEGALLVRAEVSRARGTVAGRTQAEQDAQKLLALNPKNSSGLTLQGQLLSSRQQFGEAVTQFQTVLVVEPNNLEARLGLARNLYYARQVDDSIAQYQELIKRAPADTLPRLELAQIFLDRNRFSDAETLFNEVLALQRGVAALPAARDAQARGALVRLSPGARFDSPLHIWTRVSAKLRPRVRLAQAASPTVGIGGNPGTAAPPAASFPQGPITPGAPAPGAANGDQTVPGTPPLLPPDTNGTVAPITPTVPGNTVAPPTPPTFTTPLLPGATANSAVADQVAALTGLGEIRLRQKRFADAIDFFNRALQFDPNSATPRVGLARALRGQLNFTQALTETDRALTVEPDNLRARVLRAQLLSDTGQPARAQQELDALIGSLPEDAPLETLLTLVEALNSQKNYDSALKLLDVSAQLYPTEAAPVRLKAETLNLAGRYDESLTLYDKLIAADPQDGDAVLGKARVYNYSNRLPDAETTYRQVLALQPQNYQAATELADVLGRRGNYPDAIQLYTLAIQGNPSDLSTRVELARVQRYAGQPDEAEATLNQILDSD